MFMASIQVLLLYMFTNAKVLMLLDINRLLLNEIIRACPRESALFFRLIMQLLLRLIYNYNFKRIRMARKLMLHLCPIVLNCETPNEMLLWISL